jgi:xanthine dehydrogenase accessory factor
VYSGEITVEGITACVADDLTRAVQLLDRGFVPVLIDPELDCLSAIRPLVVVDGRMTKLPPDTGIDLAALVVGLGPGFEAGRHCHAVIETRRGAFLGRVLWAGSAEPDTGIPETVANHQTDRVLRAPADGILKTCVQIGDVLETGHLIASVDGQEVRADFPGIVRGLLQQGLPVRRGLKIGDLDPRRDPRLCSQISDKALAVGGGVLEAVFTRPEIRRRVLDA